jgi:excisionase family DNA binding protein
VNKVLRIVPEAVAEKNDVVARLEKLEDSFITALQEIRAVKSELQKQSDRSQNSEKLMDAKEIAAILGQNERWVYAQVKAKKIPSIRLGKHLKFSPSDLQKCWSGNELVDTPHVVMLSSKHEEH